MGTGIEENHFDRTRIVIADDHELLRTGLRQIISADASFEIVGEASDGQEALRQICEQSPDIAVLDINMPGMGGFGVIEELRSRGVASRIVVLTMHAEQAIFAKALSLGVRGYVLKDAAAADIVNCLHAVKRGQSFTSSGVTNFLMTRAADNLRPVTGMASLTPTERKVLRLIAQYKTSPDIAAELCVSPRTVDNHRNNIAAKLEVSGSHSLLKFAVTHADEI